MILAKIYPNKSKAVLKLLEALFERDLVAELNWGQWGKEVEKDVVRKEVVRSLEAAEEGLLGDLEELEVKEL